MDRRLFLTGLLGVAGLTAIPIVARPGNAEAGVLNAGNGILDELGAPEPDVSEDEDAELQKIYHRRWHTPRRRRRRRRRGWRRVCRRYWNGYRWRRRCRRRLIWTWYWVW
jgi:hypothetical protein